MKTIWVKVTDGKHITAVTTKAKALRCIKDGNSDMTNEEAREILDDHWQEIFLDD